ncbi:MAG: hypothetical protein JNL79_12650 [Myxococcales bacterium]|nr:hypothetical protein [Myxococcales bacterium]
MVRGFLLGLLGVLGCRETGAPSAPTAPAPTASVASALPAPTPSTTVLPSSTATTSAPPKATAGPLPKVAAASCAAQKCSGQGMCDGWFEAGWLWTGVSCIHLAVAGCGLVGPDCGKLASDEATCKAAHAACATP